MSQNQKGAPKKRATSTGAMSEQAAEELWDDLFGAPKEDVPAETVADRGADRPAVAPSPRVAQGWIDIDLVDDNPFQPRAFIDLKRLEPFKRSIMEQGQLQAATARPHPTRRGRFQLVGGHRRKTAIADGANAGIKQTDPHLYIGKILLHVQAMTDAEMVEGAWAENEDREDFSVFDKARHYESLRLVETQRVAPERLQPDSNAPNRGAAQTADGLISWEELVVVRTKAGKKIPGARTLRNIASVLELGEGIERQLSQINLASETEAENGNYVGVTEKHCRALLLVKSRMGRIALLAHIEREKLSANDTFKRAQAIQNSIHPPKIEKSEENFKENVEKTENSEKNSENSAENSNSGTVAPTAATAPSTGVAASSSGSGFPTAEEVGASSRTISTATTGEPSEQNEEVQGDIVDAYLKPARERVKQAVSVYKMLKTGEEYRERAIEGLAALEADCRELRLALEAAPSQPQTIKEEDEKSENRPPSA